ncbi:MAG: hypothetical protein J6L72_01105 [Butyricicoccus sp.]|nr:hypothetical protein [Butyricicoccus sp.]
MSDSIHRDHRSRMKARFAAQGLDGLNDHEALELLLYFAVPRVDTNPIAHRLLDTFGSLHGVIDASPEALRQVKGIGENAATLIVLLREMMRRYAMDKAEKDFQAAALTTTEKIGKYLTPYFVGVSEERMVALATDTKGKVLGVEEISRGITRATDVNIRKLVEFAIRYQAAGVILAHNHPGGLALPSHDDMQTTRRIRMTLASLSISLRDHIIIAGDDFISMHDSGMLKYADG